MSADPEPRPVDESPLAIVGLSCLFPSSPDASAYWRLVRGGVDAIDEVPDTHWNPDDYFDADKSRRDHTYARRGGFLPEIDFHPLEYGIAPNALETTDTSQLLGMVVAQRALADAGYVGADARAFDRDRTSIVLGVTGALEMVIPLGARLGHPRWRRALAEAGVEDEVADDVVARIADSYVDWQESAFPGLLGNVVAGRIAGKLDLGGTNCVVDAACASALSAVHLAALELQTGRADMVVTGGVDTFNDIFMYMCFSKTPALSPTGDARPFDRDGDGTILGEGIGMVVLKRLADARRDGDRVYAVLRGIGTSSDGAGQAVYAPSADGQEKALRRAYETARVTPDTIELVEAHGTGTSVGDATELDALSRCYRGTERMGTWCAIGSVKSQIGHTKAAAGVAGLIKAALSLHHQVLPPTIKVRTPLDALGDDSPFYVTAEPRPWLRRPEHPRRAAISAFGFGGSNYHAVLEEDALSASRAEPSWDGGVLLAPFSADDAQTLGDAITAAADAIAEGTRSPRTITAELRASYDATAALRVVVPHDVDADADLAGRLRALRRQLDERGTDAPWQLPDGTAFGCGDAPGDLAMVFPGQGSQYVGMQRGLACSFPQVRDALADAEQAFDARLTDLVYPPTAFDAETRDRQDVELRATEVAQPAIGAVSLGAFGVLAHFGVAPDAVVGHSFGELTALRAAGRLDDASFHRLANVRGRLMADQPGDRGAMLAVVASPDDLAAFVAEEQLELVVANKNAPDQTVLSGTTEAIERAAALLEARDVRVRRLPVSAAFHSALVADASEPFLDVLESVSISSSDVPVYANTTGEHYPNAASEARSLLARQLARPVEFVDAIRAMHRDGARTFLEVGPGARLTGLVTRILGDDAHQALAVDASGGARSGMLDLARTLAWLSALGHSVDLSRWDADWRDTTPRPEGAKAALTFRVGGANIRTREAPARPPVAPRPKPAAVEAPPAAPTAPRVSPTPDAPTAPSPTMSTPTTPDATPNDPQALRTALDATHDALAALTAMQEQTAKLHGQFLESQMAMQSTFQSLVAQLGGAPAPATSVTQAAPAPAVPTPAPPRAEPAAAPVATPAPAPAPPAPVAAPAPAPTAPDTSRVVDALLRVVAEKTGYPADVLDLAMALEADLGIDSIKRVEILSALQAELPDAPEVGAEHLGTLRTLQDVVDLLATSMPTAAPAATAAPDATRVVDALLAVVAEKTGYPADVLDLSMALEADLGIDSIKRVEILSALQAELPDAPEVGAEHLGTLRTLQDVVDLLATSMPAAPAIATTAAPDATRVVDALLRVVAEKTGYPADVLDLAMALEADLGIDSIKRVEILSALQAELPDAPEVGAEHLGTLRTLQDVVDVLTSATPDVPSEPAPATTAEPVAARGIHRLVLESSHVGPNHPRDEVRLAPDAKVWITLDGSGLAEEIAEQLRSRGIRTRLVSPRSARRLKRPERLDGLVLLPPADGTDDLALRDAFRLAQTAGAGLRDATKDGHGSLLVGVSRLDGDFGLSGPSVDDPASGGIAGLVKTAAREWPEVTCRAIDLSPDLNDPSETAAALVDEMLHDGPIEVGLSSGGARELRLVPAPLPEDDGEIPLEKGDLVVVTGGARGVTADAALALARACAPTLLVLGRTDVDVDEPSWLASVPSVEAELKSALVEHMDGKPSPREIGAECARILARRELRASLDALEEAGAGVAYRAVDVRDERAVRRVIDEASETHGPVRGVVHGAGVLADQLILDKDDDGFERVYTTKVGGFRAVIEAIDLDALRVLAVFSSSTARFGRKGQVDYAMANEVLNKWCQQIARRTKARVAAFNWGPWDGGMVGPGLAELFASEGIALIPREAGARHLVAALSAAGDPVESVVLGGDAPTVDTTPTTAPATRELAQVFERVLDVDRCPVLRSHVMDGRAVVPMALMVEWLSHAAMHGNPGLMFHGFDDLRVLKGVVIENGDEVRVHVHAGKATKDGDVFRVVTEMRGPTRRGMETVHARAEILLTPSLPDDAPRRRDDPTTPYERDVASVYDELLFHGEELRGLRAIDACDARGIVARATAAPPPARWIERPLRGDWLADPLALDSAFQAMILWSFAEKGAGSLPCFARRYRQFERRFPQGGTTIAVTVTRSTGHSAFADIEFLGPDGKLVARLEDYECVVDDSLEVAFRANELSSKTR